MFPSTETPACHHIKIAIALLSCFMTIKFMNAFSNKDVIIGAFTFSSVDNFCHVNPLRVSGALSLSILVVFLEDTNFISFAIALPMCLTICLLISGCCTV